MSRFFGLVVCLLLSGTVSCQTPERYTLIIDVEPVVEAGLIGQPGEPNHEVMLASYRDYGPLHAMTYYGDFDALVDQHHENLMRLFSDPEAALDQWRGCSMFQHRGGLGHSLVGRNYDNVFTDLLVGWFYPVDGYASITFVPLMKFGFDAGREFVADNQQHMQLLLYAPIVSIEGMNEQGVTVTLAGLDRRSVEQLPDRESRFLRHLVREILDHAANVDDAVEIASGYNVFDAGPEVISNHIFVADPRTGSAVLEWKDGLMQVVPAEENRQIVTNSELFDIPEQQRRDNCDRYRTIYKELSGAEGPMEWTTAMDVLARVEQNNRQYVIEGRRLRISTQWSAVFDQESKEIYLCLHRDFETVYRLRFP